MPRSIESLGSIRQGFKAAVAWFCVLGEIGPDAARTCAKPMLPPPNSLGVAAIVWGVRYKPQSLTGDEMRRLPDTCTIWLLTILFASSVLITTSTQAVPMFARKYGVSCSTCHTTAPRLNETGYKFRAAGFRMPEEIGRESEEPFDIYNYLSARIRVRTGVTRSTVGSLTNTKHQTLVQALEIYPFTGAWGKYFSSNIKLTFAPVTSPAVAIENLYAKVNGGNERRFFGGRVGIFHPYDGYGAADNPATISRPFFQTNPANLNQST